MRGGVTLILELLSSRSTTRALAGVGAGAFGKSTLLGLLLRRSLCEVVGLDAAESSIGVKGGDGFISAAPMPVAVDSLPKEVAEIVEAVEPCPRSACRVRVSATG